MKRVSLTLTNKTNFEKMLKVTNSGSIWFFLSKLTLFTSVIYAVTVIASALYMVPEMTDASYYVLQTKFADQFYIQLHPYGIYWLSFFGENSIYTNRLIFLTLMVTAPLFFMMRLLKATGVNDELTRFRLLVSAIIFWCLFGSGVVDVSYNALVALIICIALGISLCPIEKLRPMSDVMLRSLLLGMIAPILLLTKITTAPIVGLMVIVYFFASLPHSRDKIIVYILVTIVCGVAGSLIAFLLFYLRGFGTPFSLTMQVYDSITTFSLLQSHQITFESVVDKTTDYFFFLFYRIDRLLFNYAAVLALPFLHSLWLIRTKDPSLIKGWLIIGLTILIAWLCINFLFISERFESFEALRYDFSALIVLITLLLAYQNYVVIKTRDILKFLPLCLVSFFLVLGTNNSYSYFIPFYIGFFVMVALSFIHFDWLKKESQSDSINSAIHHGLVTAFIISIAVVLFSNIAILSEKPYRFFGSLTGNLQIVEFGVPPERLFASQPLAEGYSAVTHLKRSTPITQESQTVIDWTGRSPGMALHLGVRAVETSWLVGSYPGEDSFAEGLLTFADEKDIANAWIIISDKMTRSPDLLKSMLIRYGRSFPEDYEVIGVFVNPNQKSTNQIFGLKKDAVPFKNNKQ